MVAQRAVGALTQQLAPEGVGLEPSDWRLVDEASRRIHAAPELGPTVRSVVDVFVPAYAHAALVALRDDRDELRIAATAHRTPSHADVLSAAVARRLDFVGTPFASAPGCRVEELALARGGTDFGRLLLVVAESTTPRRASLLRTIAARCSVALDNARRFERERNVALTFENAALVSELPVIAGYRFDAIYRAGRLDALVGGDWYDAFPLGDGRAVVSVGDVVGSGLGAAVTMLNVRQTIRGVAQVNPDPAMMLHAADGTLRSQYPDRFVTAFVGVLDPVTQMCSYANAGHPAPLLRLADGSLQQPSGHNAPLGLGLQQNIDVHHVTLAPGALFVLYTDGLIESTKDVLEGEARLESAMRNVDSAPGVAHRLHDIVLASHSRDDVAVLAIAIEETAPARRWRFDPIWPDVARRVRDELREQLEGARFAPDRMIDVELTFAELMGNAIRYAPGTVEMILVRQDGHLVLHLLDKGPGFHFSPRLPSDLYSEFGRGLFLISQLVSDFTVERRPGGGSHARIVLS
jgi:anti-sigma regulatory factor (Ser/Thr protein kinase)